MMFLAPAIGLGLPAIAGWLLLKVLEGKTPVLLGAERWTLGCVLALTGGMFDVFVIHVVTGIPLSLWLFLGVYAAAIAVLFPFAWRLRMLPGHAALPPSPPMHNGMKIAVGVLGLWIAAKVALTGITFLMLTPTYLDDTLDNWNLRGKVFFHDQALTLVLPNEDPVTSPKGVSSYPPAVPMIKAWVSHLAGQWADPLVNGIHIVWYLAPLVLLYSAIRRVRSRGWALLGVYILAGLPLFLMHGTNTYGDAFLATHVLAAVTMLWMALAAEDAKQRASFTRIGALCAALLPFTKNEGLLVYLPPLLLILFVGALWQWKRGAWTKQDVVRAFAWYGVSLLLVAGPWLWFKWSQELTFGNAKPFTSLGFKWHENVLLSIAINTFFEGNWLLLFPLFLGLIVWQWRAALGRYASLTAFFLIVYCGQMFLYLFTDLAVEALKQTGYARGLIHLAPMVVLLTMLLLSEGRSLLKGELQPSKNK